MSFWSPIQRVALAGARAARDEIFDPVEDRVRAQASNEAKAVARKTVATVAAIAAGSLGAIGIGMALARRRP